MSERIVIDPITRLEGHGKIDIILDKKGNVDQAYFQVPELRGFEKFCEGRLAEELPRITPKICGVCPTAHHMASAKALDDLYKVEPPPTAKLIREMVNSAFVFEDHILHFFYLGGPDFLVGPQQHKSQRNILGVISKVGVDAGKKVIEIRKKMRNIITKQGGRVIHPVCNLPGGVSKGVTPEDQALYIETAQQAIDFSRFALEAFENLVLKNDEYLELISGDIYYLETYYMGLVDDQNKVNLYDGKVRVVDPQGKEFVKFAPKDYLKHVREHVETWTYPKFPYLKKVGWNGFTDGMDSGIFRVAPLARLNAAEGMATPAAQQEYEKMFDQMGGKPLHHTLAYHWARLIEALYAAERVKQLAEDSRITDPHIRNIPESTPDEGVGIVEAPRGTLIHHYQTDPQGKITQANLIVATVHNNAAICMSIEKAAKKLINNHNISEGILNMVEMAFRAYDPCFACASHSLPGQMPLIVQIFNHNHNKIDELRRD
ncbi:MAG: F420-nonreducing hydrogenase [Desulfuromonas sp. SDB]|nr:MAG: F420-nonreducing hydrogenase [Desulfuromonas sp. SDB]